MRRVEIVEGVRQVRAALEETGLEELAQSVASASALGNEQQGNGKKLIFQAFKKYSIAYEKFTPAARDILAILGLEELQGDEFWRELYGEGLTSKTTPVVAALNFAIRHMEKFITLIGQRSLDDVQRQLSAEERRDIDMISVVLIEKDGRFSTVDRITDALMSVSLMYNICARILGVPGGDLSVMACDSGSDKSFDIVGGARAIAGLKVLILDLWDRVVYYREWTVERHLDRVVGSLPYFVKIDQLREEGLLGQEEAELMRRRLMESVSKFLSCGAIIPEINDRTQFDPRSLMAPEPKLLMPAAVASGPEEREGVGELTGEDREMLEELRQRLRSGKTS